MSRYGSQFAFSTWIIVLDSNETIINQKQIGGDDTDILAAVTKVDDGFILIHQSNSGISHDKTTSAFGPTDFWLVKVDFSLNIVWQKQYGSTSVDQAFDVTANNLGEILISGQTNGGLHPSGNRTAPQKGFIDAWLLKLDSQGNEIWQISLGGDSVESRTKICLDEFGNIYALMYSDSKPSLDKTQDTIGLGDLWICKLNPNGELLSQTIVGGTEYEFYGGWDILFVENQLIVSALSTSGVSGNKTTPHFGESDVWALSLDTALNINWQLSLGGDQFEYLGEFYYSEKRNTLFQVCTSNSGITGNKTVANVGAYDYWLVEFDLNGNILNQFGAGGLGDDRGTSITEFNNQLVLAGSSTSPSGFGDKTEPSRGDRDIWLTAFDVALSAPVLDANQKALRLFPNPANHSCYLQGMDEPVSYKLYSITGALAQEGTAQFEIPLVNLNSGVYLLKIDGYQPQRLIVR
jgi:hypothetical protein